MLSETIELSKVYKWRKKRNNFHSHNQHNYRLMMRSPECTFDSPTGRHALTDSPRGNVWKHAPDYLDLMCEQRFGSSLFGLVSHQVPNRDGLSMTSSGWTNTKWSRRHREGLGGAALPWGRKAQSLADVSQISIWEVNIWSQEERGNKGDMQVGRKITVEGWEQWQNEKKFEDFRSLGSVSEETLETENRVWCGTFGLDLSLLDRPASRVSVEVRSSSRIHAELGLYFL